VKGCRLAPPVARARERPRSRRAAEQCDELAPLHSITSSARATSRRHGHARIYRGQGPPGHPVQRACRGRWPDRLRSCLLARPRRHCVEAQGLRLSFRPLTRLAQDEEPGCTSGDTRSGGGLGEMTRRKREIVGPRNERDFPYLVELAGTSQGLRATLRSEPGAYPPADRVDRPAQRSRCGT